MLTPCDLTEDLDLDRFLGFDLQDDPRSPWPAVLVLFLGLNDLISLSFLFFRV